MRFKRGAIFDRPSRCILVVASLLLILSPGVFWLEIDGTTRSMFPEGGKIFDWDQEFSANFSTETTIAVVVRADDVFAPATLRKLKSFATDLEGLDLVKDANHLFSVKYPKQRPGGFRTLPLIEEIPRNSEESKDLREEILSNPILRGAIVNESGTAAAFYPTLNEDLEVTNLQKYAVESLDTFVQEAREQGLDAYFAGGPVIAEAIVRNIWRDLTVLGPVTFLVIAGLILLFFRWRVALVFNLCTSAFSVIATFGFMGWVGIEITPLISVIMILIFIIGCTEDIHLLSEYILWRGEGQGRAEAFHSLRHTVFSALLLTSVSTAMGFYMTALSPVPALRDFAIACGTGILLNFVFTIFLAPVFLRSGVPHAVQVIARGRIIKGVVHFLVRTATRFGYVSGLFALAFAACAIWGVTHVVVDNDFMHFFTKHSPIRHNIERLEDDFGGRASLIVTVDTNKRYAVWDPDSIDRIAEFQDKLSDSFERVTGLTSYLREYLYQTGESKDRERGKVSLNSEQIEFCRAIFGNRFLGRYLDFDNSRTAIWIRSSITGSNDVRSAQDKINQFAEEILPSEWEVRVLGEPVGTATAADSITTELFTSLFFLTVTVTIILMFYFRSWKFGLLALIPNLLPVIATFGFMGWSGIPMGTGVFAVAMVAFGIAVDDTIHLFVRFSHELKNSSNQGFERVLRDSLGRELFPVLVTSTTLIVGFSVLLFSDFQVHRETGLLFIVAIGTAMLADLFVTPLVLRGVRSCSS
ncbi:MAG: hypothetical protein CMO55_28760 [Verrucomicrobiales bacterium]|nr:hypothetical protein [Verrucomicrobiales bacterium]